MNWKFFSIAVILAVGAAVYYPVLVIGFWTDDYGLIEIAGRSSFWEYWSIHLDPDPKNNPFFRPMQGLEWWIGYALFGGSAFWFHVVQVGLHLANIVLFFNAIVRFTKRLRLALIAALIYSTLSVYGLALFWMAVIDPLMSFFYLLTINLWIDYLDKPNPRDLLFTFIAFLCALLSKETGITLPVILFLIDRWIVSKPLSLHHAVKRYALFFIGASIYGLIKTPVLLRNSDQGLYVDSFASALIHLRTLSFPWGMDSSIGYIWLLIVLGYGVYAVFKRKWHIVFLYIATVLPMLPVTLLPFDLAVAPRYLYLPLMGSAIGVAAVIDGVAGYINRGVLQQKILIVLPLVLTLVIMSGSAGIAESAVNFAGVTRQERLRYQPIFRQYPQFASGTLLYFIDSPVERGMFFLRYGGDVHIADSSGTNVVNFQRFNSAFVFYQDDEQNWHKKAWDIHAVADATPALPAVFEQTLALETVQISNNKTQPGDTLVLLLHWRVIQRMDRDYTVFVHIVDKNGNIASGSDYLPQRFGYTTSYWRKGQRYGTGIVVPMEAALAPGNYTIQVGLYHLPTMQRLWIVNSSGTLVDDKIIIEPFSIIQ